MTAMATNTDEFERLRAVGLSEKYSTARHPLRFYLNVALSANYTIPETFLLPLKDYIYRAVETLINQHPILSAIPLGEDTKEPYFARLPEIDLTQPISFQKPAQSLCLDEHDSELQSLLETQHNTGFTAPLPFWRLIVLADDDSARRFTAVFVYHHGLGDGTSGKAFQRTFLQALRGAASLKSGEAKQVVTPPKTALLPNLEAVHPLPISMLYLLKAIFRKWFDSKPDPKLWAGGPIQLPLKTQVRLVVLTAAQTSALVQVCRKHDTTVTCAVETAIARSLFPHIPDKFTVIEGSLPITQRPWLPDTITDDSMGVYVQTLEQTFSRKTVTQEAFPWSEAQRTRRSVTKELALKSKDTSVGLFKYVQDYRRDLCETKVGKARTSTFELSSLGVVKTENVEDPSVPQMGRVIFTQCASVTGSALEFSMITGADGCLGLGISWQTNVLKDDMVQDVIDTLKKELHQLSG
ncbi:alcohol acetyltransferase [Aspergillus aurantiobrunneus]